MKFAFKIHQKEVGKHQETKYYIKLRNRKVS